MELYEEVNEHVARIGTVMVNLYLVGRVGEPWVIVDAGLPMSAPLVRRAVRARYGDEARPEAIVLTHGHFDHVGSVRELADGYGVPVYAHRLEMPFLTGKSDYPPQDPTVGGAGAQLSRVFPHHGYDFGDRVRPLPDDGSVPGLEGWRWVHTPGHSPGHVSLWRESDRVLVAGDAVITTDVDCWTDQAVWRPRLDRPPAYFTHDWERARQSVEALAELDPWVIASGHGYPVVGTDTPSRLRKLARTFEPPAHGRYVGRPAAFDEGGVVSVPPPVEDVWGKRAAVGALLMVAAMGAVAVARRRRAA